jgi:hypothetical protein
MLTNNPLLTAVASSAFTSMVFLLREAGGTRNELRNLSESIATIKSDSAKQQDRIEAQFLEH